jgi:hypothetical protein
VRDLRRLLELYQRWQPRVFNHGSYNQFEQALEKMSGTHVVKARHGCGCAAEAVRLPLSCSLFSYPQKPLAHQHQCQSITDIIKNPTTASNATQGLD